MVLEKQIFHPLAVEQLTESDDAAKAAPAVGGVVERAVDRGSETQRRAVERAQVRQREAAIGGDVVDPVFEMERLAAGSLGDLVECRDDCIGRAAVAAPRIGDQQQDAFGHQTSVRVGSLRSLCVAHEAQGFDPLQASHRVPTAALPRPGVREKCPGRRIIETEDVAELDVGVSVMAVVVLG